MPKGNEEVKANLLEGNTRFSSASTVMQNVLTELDTISVSLNLSWLGPSHETYTTCHNDFVKVVGIARDVLQKCAAALKTLHDAIVEAEQKAKKEQDDDLTINMVLLGVLFFAAAVASIVGPLLAAVDEAVAGSLDAIASETASISSVESTVTEVESISEVASVGN